MELTLCQPLPSRGAASAIRHQVVDTILSIQPQPGTPLPSYDELADQAQVSRSTVRRAIQVLVREGWVEHQEGRGNFVGPRVALGNSIPRPRQRSAQQEIRLGLLVMDLGHIDQDPCTVPLLGGLDAVALDQQLSIEVIGGKTNDLDTIIKRISRSRPDILAVFPHTPVHLHIIGQARQLGIRVICVAYLPELEVPCVHEDSIQAGRECVAHLVEHGHERIACLQFETLAWWAAHRRRGIEEGLAQHGCDPSKISRLSLWPEHWQLHHDQIEAHLTEHRPTAVICTGVGSIPSVSLACQRLGLSIPDDISVITIDKQTAITHIDGVALSHVSLPYHDMGQAVAQIARTWTDTGSPTFPDPIACGPIKGDSVRKL